MKHMTVPEICAKIDEVIYRDDVLACDAVTAIGHFARCMLVNIRHNFGEQCAVDSVKMIVRIMAGLAEGWDDDDDDDSESRSIVVN